MEDEQLLDAKSRLLKQLEASVLRTPVSRKHAAVLVPLFVNDEGLQVLLTQRSKSLSSHRVSTSCNMHLTAIMLPHIVPGATSLTTCINVQEENA